MFSSCKGERNLNLIVKLVARTFEEFTQKTVFDEKQCPLYFNLMELRYFFSDRRQWCAIGVLGSSIFILVLLLII